MENIGAQLSRTFEEMLRANMQDRQVRLNSVVKAPSAFLQGFNAPSYFESEEEAFYAAEALEEMALRGQLDPEPVEPSDAWPVLTSAQLLAEYGSPEGDL